MDRWLMCATLLEICKLTWLGVELRSTSKLWCGVRFSLVVISLMMITNYITFLNELDAYPPSAAAIIPAPQSAIWNAWILQLLQVQTVWCVFWSIFCPFSYGCFQYYIYIFFSYSVHSAVSEISLYFLHRLNFWGLSSWKPA